MASILVLIDFTETSGKALTEAISIAKHKNESLVLCHISDDNADDDLVQLKSFEVDAMKAGVAVESVVRKGNLYSETASYVKELMPSLVVVGTHGKKGIVQQLLGAKIQKLVEGIKASVLVVSDFTQTIHGGFKNILLPVATHPNFIKKVEAAGDLLGENGKIHIFTVIKPGTELSDAIVENIDKTKAYLEAKEIEYDNIQVEASTYSVGYSQETIKYAKNNSVDLVAIMTSVTEQNRYFGKLDKENLLVNEEGIAILSVTD